MISEHELQPGERFHVLTIECAKHPGSILVKLSTRDGKRVAIYDDGTYPRGSDFEQFVAPDDPEAREDLAALGIRSEVPVAQPKPGQRRYTRFKLRCPRPSCSTDLQLTGAQLHRAFDPFLQCMFAAGITEATLRDLAQVDAETVVRFVQGLDIGNNTGVI